MSYLDPVAFTGDASIWCPYCATEKYGPDDAPDELEKPYRTDDEGNEVGAIFSTSFESDTPEYCAGCDEFLENDLTGEGVTYVANATGPRAVEWQDHYGIAGGWAAAPHVSLEAEIAAADYMADYYRRADALGEFGADEKAIKWANDARELRARDNRLATYAWPGGYPLFYMVGDDDSFGKLCPECAQKIADAPGDYSPDQFRYRAVAPNWEDSELYCDQCGERIPCAYGDPDDDEPRPAPVPVLPGQIPLVPDEPTMESPMS